MTDAPDNGAIGNGDRCEVIAGTHKGRSGTVEDWHLAKSGHASITVREDGGARFKTLARSVRKV
jgi:ribosomal protein S4E